MPEASNTLDQPFGAVPAPGNPGYGFSGAVGVDHTFESAMGGVPCVDWDTPYDPQGDAWFQQIQEAVAVGGHWAEEVSLETFHATPVKRPPGRPRKNQ